MDSDALAAAFASMGMPGFSPLMSLNLSEPSATKRLLQIPMYGLFSNDIRPKFSKPDHVTTDLHPIMKKTMKETVTEVDKIVAQDAELKKRDWTPVLYVYELYRGHAQNETEYGHLVFADNTCSRFLLIRVEGSVKCSNGNCPLDHDYAEICELQAQQFFALAKYLPIPEPKWVRATFTSDEHRSVAPDFLAVQSDSDLSSRPTQGLKPGVIHVNSKNFKPCLSDEDLDSIDAFLSSIEKKVPDEAAKKGVLVPKGEKAPSFHAKYLPPEVTGVPKRYCAGCRELFAPDDLKRCGTCKAVFYCGIFSAA
ncbi:hypothetical protein JCM8097_001560 [Rhodosporidiobolus ruineniae]